MNTKLLQTVLLAASVFVTTNARANVNELISRELSQKLGAKRAEVISVLSVIPAQPVEVAESVQLIEENARGEARLLVRARRDAGQSEPRHAEYRVKFAAWSPGWVAVRRIVPGEALAREALEQREINIAEGLAHEYRGVLLGASEDPSKLEARQTIVAGSFVSATAVQRVPDHRRGDSVRLELLSGGVQLTVPAQLLESSTYNQKVRVQAVKSKREFVGILRDGPRVEVTL